MVFPDIALASSLKPWIYQKLDLNPILLLSAINMEPLNEVIECRSSEKYADFWSISFFLSMLLQLAVHHWLHCSLYITTLEPITIFVFGYQPLL
jgi:hypothetical protein